MTDKTKPQKPASSDRRDFVKKLGTGTAGILAAGTAPYAFSQSNPVKWRLQSYSGAPLGAHVVLPQIVARPDLREEMYRWREPIAWREEWRTASEGAAAALAAIPYLQRVYEQDGAAVYAVVGK